MASASPVSVVVPTFNRARLLESTLGSLLAQDPRPHVIVVDDGSTDDTAAVLERFGVEVVANPPGGWGAGRARNAGLERVTTPLVAFVDSDDLLFPGALATLAAALAEAPSAPFASRLRARRLRASAGSGSPRRSARRCAPSWPTRSAPCTRATGSPRPARWSGPMPCARSAGMTHHWCSPRTTTSGSRSRSATHPSTARRSSPSTAATTPTGTRR